MLAERVQVVEILAAGAGKQGVEFHQADVGETRQRDPVGLGEGFEQFVAIAVKAEANAIGKIHKIAPGTIGEEGGKFSQRAAQGFDQGGDVALGGREKVEVNREAMTELEGEGSAACQVEFPRQRVAGEAVHQGAHGGRDGVPMQFVHWDSISNTSRQKDRCGSGRARLPQVCTQARIWARGRAWNNQRNSARVPKRRVRSMSVGASFCGSRRASSYS